MPCWVVSFTIVLKNHWVLISTLLWGLSQWCSWQDRTVQPGQGNCILCFSHSCFLTVHVNPWSNGTRIRRKWSLVDNSILFILTKTALFRDRQNGSLNCNQLNSCRIIVSENLWWWQTFWSLGELVWNCVNNKKMEWHAYIHFWSNV